MRFHPDSEVASHHAHIASVGVLLRLGHRLHIMRRVRRIGSGADLEEARWLDVSRTAWLPSASMFATAAATALWSTSLVTNGCPLPGEFLGVARPGHLTDPVMKATLPTRETHTPFGAAAPKREVLPRGRGEAEVVLHADSFWTPMRIAPSHVAGVRTAFRSVAHRRPTMPRSDELIPAARRDHDIGTRRDHEHRPRHPA